MIRIFDIIAVGELSIIIFRTEIFANRVKVSCVALIISKDQKKLSKSSQGKDLTKRDNE